MKNKISELKAIDKAREYSGEGGELSDISIKKCKVLYEQALTDQSSYYEGKVVEAIKNQKFIWDTEIKQAIEVLHRDDLLKSIKSIFNTEDK